MPSGNEMKALDYGIFLADLEAKRAALDQVIVSIRSLMASGALAVGSGEAWTALNGPAVPGSYGGDVPIGAFLGKSIPDAAKLCLQIVRRKMTTREIADSLQKGGIETTAKTSFAAIVHSILARTAKTGGGIVKFDRSHWGLADWLPPGVRNGPDKVSGRRARKAKAKRAGSQSHSRPNQEVEATTVQGDNGQQQSKLWQRGVDFIKSRPSEELTARQIGEKLGIHSRVVSMILAKPVKDGTIRMSAPGTYTTARPSV